MPFRDTLNSLGLLILRVGISALMLVHGLQKANAYGALKESFPDPLGIGNHLSLVSAIGSEVGCSILLILGLGTRFAALPLAITMVVALFIVHAADPWKVKELAAVYLCVYTALMLTGGGKFSLDHLLFKRPSPPQA